MPDRPSLSLTSDTTGCLPPTLADLCRDLDGVTGDDLLARLRRDQQRRWRIGELPPTEEYLAAFPALACDSERALALIYGEVLLHGATGSPPDVGEYLRRFPAYAEQIALLFQLDEALDDTAITNERSQPAEPAAEGPIPGYELLHEIGRGGMGVVYKARDLRLNRTVALKLMATGVLASPERIARFHREAELAARVSHPNVVPVYDAGEAAGHAYLAMELVDGPSLAQYLAGAPQSPLWSAAVVELLAGAVHAAHVRGVIHRDLKPANVLLCPELGTGDTAQHPFDGTSVRDRHAGYRTPKITDFGLAMALDAEIDLTSNGAVVGTPCYMAPEQAAGTSEAIGPATDVYALGAILYELLVGQPPFRASTRLATLALVRSDEPLPPRRLQPRVPRDLETICLKCLAKAPERRYASAADLGDDLRRFRAGEPIRARPVGTIGRCWRWGRRNPGWATAIGTAAVLLLVIAAGASFGVVQLRAALAESEGHRREAEFARIDADSRRLDSLIAQAESFRTSGRPGQRFRALEVLADASDLAGRLRPNGGNTVAIRNRAASAMALPDMWVAHRIPRWPSGSARVDVDLDRGIYARTDVHGRCTVRRFDNDAPICDVPAPPGPLPRGPLYPVLSPDGRTLLTFWIDTGRVIGWDIVTGLAERFAIDDVFRFDVSPDGHRVALSHHDGTLTVLELPTGVRLGRYPANAVGPSHVAWHPQLPLVALAGVASNRVAIRDVESGATKVEEPIAERCVDIAWCHDGKVLALIDAQGTLQLRDADNLGERRRIPLGADAAMVSVAPVGRLAAVNTTAGEMILVDLDAGKELVRQPPMHTPVLRPRFTRDGRRLSITADGDQLGWWDIAAGCEYREMARNRAMYGIATHPSEPRLVAVVGADGLAFWDIEAGIELATVAEGVIARAVFEPSGHLVTTGPTGTFRREVRVEGNGFRVGHPVQLPIPPGNSLSTSRDGRMLTVASAYRSLPLDSRAVWVQELGQAPRAIDRGGDPRHASVSPDGQWLATCRDTIGEVKLWNVRDGSLVRTLTTWGTHPQFSPDGHWLAVGGDRGRLFSVGSWAEWTGFAGIGAFSRDSKLLAVYTNVGGGFRLLDVATGDELVRIEAPTQQPVALPVFSADGAWLVGVVQGPRSCLCVWDLRRLRAGLSQRGLDWDAAPLPVPTVRSTFRVTIEP
ncbi:MAG: WD40 repeat domain-containing serine/threonine-protein kinase [Gemmataceae bacterium]